MTRVYSQPLLCLVRGRVVVLAERHAGDALLLLLSVMAQGLVRLVQLVHLIATVIVKKDVKYIQGQQTVKTGRRQENQTAVNNQ